MRRVWVPAALHAGEQCVCVNQEILTFTGLLWMNGQPAAELEQMVMRHCRDRAEPSARTDDLRSSMQGVRRVYGRKYSAIGRFVSTRVRYGR